MTHPHCDRSSWLEARKRLLAKEKAFTRLKDELSAERRALPWVRVDKTYTFETTAGARSLAQLFGSHSQLLVYHFMFAPEWDQGCKSCSFWADGFGGIPAHLAERDVSFMAISRAPLAKLRAFAQRLGWSFPWASSFGSEFNFDFHVSFAPDAVSRGDASYNYGPLRFAATELPGVSVFAKEDDGAVFHTYSSYGRGIDILNPAYQCLDLVPKGRDENELPATMSWVKLRDQYGQ